LAATRTDHLGPTIFRSPDLGKTWKEATRPPAFAKVASGAGGRAVNHMFCLAAGHVSEPGVWYVGTSPEGLFRSEDGGDHWAPVSGFNDSPWANAPYPEEASRPPQSTPDGDILHSIMIDPRDPQHMYVAMSANAGGVFTSLDQGASWRPIGKTRTPRCSKPSGPTSRAEEPAM
jgi:hypothetical protein